jgi:hypothetical protein
VEAELVSNLLDGGTGLVGIDHVRTLGLCWPLAYTGGSAGGLSSLALGQLQQATNAFPLVRKVRVKR